MNARTLLTLGLAVGLAAGTAFRAEAREMASEAEGFSAERLNRIASV